MKGPTQTGKKEGYKKDIKIKPDEIKDQFSEDLFEQLIKTFVERDYEDKKRQIEEALEAKDAPKLKYVCHTFKTTARMLCIEDFALECQEIENEAVKENVDWTKMETLVGQWLVDFHSIFEDAQNIYDQEYKPQPVEIMNEFVDINKNDSLSKSFPIANINDLEIPEQSSNFEKKTSMFSESDRRDSELMDKVSDLDGNFYKY